MGVCQTIPDKLAQPFDLNPLSLPLLRYLDFPPHLPQRLRTNGSNASDARGNRVHHGGVEQVIFSTRQQSPFIDRATSSSDSDWLLTGHVVNQHDVLTTVERQSAGIANRCSQSLSQKRLGEVGVKQQPPLAADLTDSPARPNDFAAFLGVFMEGP
jgi:hypothetical protein